jgi:hypothetical protein
MYLTTVMLLCNLYEDMKNQLFFFVLGFIVSILSVVIYHINTDRMSKSFMLKCFRSILFPISAFPFTRFDMSNQFVYKRSLIGYVIDNRHNDMRFIIIYIIISSCLGYLRYFSLILGIMLLITKLFIQQIKNVLETCKMS